MNDFGFKYLGFKGCEQEFKTTKFGLQGYIDGTIEIENKEG